MLLSLSWPVLLRRNEPGGQSIELAMRLPELVIDVPDARGERLDMRGCGLGCSGGDLHRRLARNLPAIAASRGSGAFSLPRLYCLYLCHASAMSLPPLRPRRHRNGCHRSGDRGTL